MFGERVWKRFAGREAVTKDEVPEFWIQTLPNDLEGDVLDAFDRHFRAEEPVSMYLGFGFDWESVRESRQRFVGVIKEGLSLVCLTRDSNGRAVLAGASLLMVAHRDSPPLVHSGKCIQKSRKVANYIWDRKNAHEALGAERLLKECGLIVLPEYRGHGIGLKLVETWVDVARALQLKAVVAMFTSKFSQSIGDRAGFQDLAQISYKKMGELDPELRIPGIEAHTKTIKTTYKLC